MSTGLSPTVSVVIVSHNGRGDLEACLPSVLDQTLPSDEYEVVVVDNASADGSADFVAGCYPSVRLIRLDRNLGPGPAIALVEPQLKGKYMAYLNQDVVVNRRWLSELLSVMVSFPSVGAVVSNMILPQWPEYDESARHAPIPCAYVCDLTSMGVYDFRRIPVTPAQAPIAVLAVNGAGVLFNREAVNSLGYTADPGFRAHAEDMDLGLRLNAAGYQVLMAPQSVVYHHTEWHFKLTRRNLRRALLVTQNTILAFYKVSYPAEFRVILPRLVLGKVVKAGQHCKSPLTRWVLRLSAVPVALLGFAGALWKMPAYRERRRVTLEHRSMEPGWLVHRLLDAEWKPDPAVWERSPSAAVQ